MQTNALVFTLFVGFTAFAAWFVLRPYRCLQTVDCGNGNYIEILRPNGFCDVAEPVHYQASGVTPDEPPAFGIWTCGNDMRLAPLKLRDSELAVLVDAQTKSRIYAMVDFQSRWHWPSTWSRKVTDEAKSKLTVIHSSFPDVWFYGTYDGSLTGPQQSCITTTCTGTRSVPQITNYINWSASGDV